jgi:selenide,water dikinase
MPKFSDPNLIIGAEDYDDAGIYKISDDLVIIQTVDFFTPMVDDPYAFGEIAAANALSDIYAMGGKPITAMNIACFPSCGDIEVISQILLGGANKVKEAGCVLLGGHSIDDKEPKFGLAVTGIAKPHEIYTNKGAKPGDYLILTKKLGNGILATAIKAEMLAREIEKELIAEMAELNKEAALAAKKAEVHTVTDITGFGFLGHLGEITTASKVSACIWADRLPVWEAAAELAQMGFVPGGAYRNREYLGSKVRFNEDVPMYLQDIMFDPQTSGGLLIAVAPGGKELLEDALKEKKVSFQVVGKILKENPGEILVKGAGEN